MGTTTSIDKTAPMGSQMITTMETTEVLMAAAGVSTGTADKMMPARMISGASAGTALEPVAVGESSAAASAIVETPVSRGGQKDGGANAEPALPQITMTNTVARDVTETIAVEVDNETRAKTLVGRTNLNPFVAVNSIYNSKNIIMY